MASRIQPAPNRLAHILALIRALVEPIMLNLHKAQFTHAVHDAAAAVLDPYSVSLAHVAFCDNVAHQLVQALHGPPAHRAFYQNLFFQVEAEMLIDALTACFGPGGSHPDWLNPAEFQFALRECEPFRVSHRFLLSAGIRKPLPRYSNGRPTEYPDSAYVRAQFMPITRAIVAPTPADFLTAPESANLHYARIRADGLETAGAITTVATEEASQDTTQAIVAAMTTFQQEAQLTVSLDSIRALLYQRCAHTQMSSPQGTTNRRLFIESLARRLHAELLLRRPFICFTPTSLDFAIQDAFGPAGQAPSALLPADYQALRQTAGHFTPEKPPWTRCRYCNDDITRSTELSCVSCHSAIDDQGTPGPLCHCCLHTTIHQAQPDDAIALASHPASVKYQSTDWHLASNLPRMSTELETHMISVFRTALPYMLRREYDATHPGAHETHPERTRYVKDLCVAVTDIIHALATHSRRATPETPWTGVQFYRSSLSINVTSRHLAAPPPTHDHSLDGDGPDE